MKVNIHGPTANKRWDETHGNGVLPRVPTRMQDLLVEVQSLHLHRVPQSPRPVLRSQLVPREGPTNLLRLERGLVRL